MRRVVLVGTLLAMVGLIVAAPASYGLQPVGGGAASTLPDGTVFTAPTAGCEAVHYGHASDPDTTWLGMNGLILRGTQMLQATLLPALTLQPAGGCETPEVGSGTVTGQLSLSWADSVQDTAFGRSSYLVTGTVDGTYQRQGLHLTLRLAMTLSYCISGCPSDPSEVFTIEAVIAPETAAIGHIVGTWRVGA
ncbi:MAG: hypothetical protein QOH64_1596 [Acidimicrobiaceae bacterium]|jgi:hypothetical protein